MRIFSFILIFSILLGCTQVPEDQKLRIGYLGAKPDVKVDAVIFEKVTLDGLHNKVIIDALFVTQDTFHFSLSEEYINYFKSTNIPVFFIGLEKDVNQILSLSTGYEENKGNPITAQYIINENNKIVSGKIHSSSTTLTGQYQSIIQILHRLLNRNMEKEA